jgi:F-type H+-transporting ATPase subunit delta
MTSTAVATRYAQALADAVMAAGSGVRAEDALAELRVVEAVLAESADLHNVLASPAVPPSRKRAVVGRIADLVKTSRICRNFLFVLIDHRRIGMLPAILQSFEVTIDQRLGYERAEVSSPRDLTEAQRTAIQAVLERMTGKRIRMRFALDASLIGGVVARIGSTVYDGSVRGQLESLERRLAAEN